MKTADWICAALCGAWLLALLQASVPDHDLLRALWSQTAAAWIQAIGSVAAIVAAIAVGRTSAAKGRQVALEMRNRALAERIEVAVHIANEARVAADQVRLRFKGGDLAMGKDDFDSVADAIDALSLGDIPSGRMVRELMTIRRLLRMIEKTAELYESIARAAGPSGRRAILKVFAKRRRALERSYNRLTDAAQAALDRLNDSHTSPPPEWFET